VNGVEWIGRRLNLTATATGTVLAAFGTALPESAVTFVAVVVSRIMKIIERMDESGGLTKIVRCAPAVDDIAA
jgi:hypothetical protein